MKTADLRTRQEKILYPIAIIFSAIFWILIVGVPLASLFAQKPKIVEPPCVFIDVDEYRALSAEEARLEEMTSDCLDRAEIPDEIYAEALKIVGADDTPSPLLGVSITYFYLLMFFLFAYASTALAMAHIRLNGVRLSPTQYATFYKIYEETAKELGLTSIPHAYIIQAGGDLNAFAVKISRKKMIVFFADLIEVLVEGEKFDELRAVAAHELTHVRLKHVHYWLLLWPFQLLPFVGPLFSRARELSADRGALAVAKNPHIVSQALLKLVTGKYVAKEINMEEYVDQLKTERGVFVWLAKITSTHPPIPRRVKILLDTKVLPS